MEITEVKVYDIEECVMYSGLSHSANGDPLFNLKRARMLGHATTGSGHDVFLSGITVSMNVKATHIWWMQFMRYSFQNIVTSQSKMHQVMEFDINIQSNEYVSENTRHEVQRLKDIHLNEQSEESFNRVIYNLPMGLELKARVRTNFLQLKTIYGQRKSHKLKEWADFCSWMKTIDHYGLFIGGGDGHE